MVRRTVALLLVFNLFFLGSPRRIHVEEARAIAPALVLAPEAAVAMLYALIAACALAAAIGVISNQQKDSYQGELQGNIDSIQEAVKRGLAESGRAITNAVTKMALINGTLGAFALTCPILLRNAVSGNAAKTREARAATVGECDPSLRGSPYDCCPDFMKKFGGAGEKMNSVGRFAYRVRYFARHAITRQCCFEWDSLHGRFEVYQRGNHEPIKHLGERACARSEDLDDDICAPSFADKADLLSARHAPRNGCP
jgi:hypothetical protein